MAVLVKLTQEKNQILTRKC